MFSFQLEFGATESSPLGQDLADFLIQIPGSKAWAGRGLASEKADYNRTETNLESLPFYVP